jgi:tRNA A37 threonylcarbamoyladenosine dehydratase
MNEAIYQRTALLLGDEALQRLRKAHILVLGVGGVGGAAAEQLCRMGVGQLTLLDGDTVDPTNLNRQVAALHSTKGLYKAEVLAARFRDINPDGIFNAEVRFLKADECEELLERPFDLVIDAIDDVPAKVSFLRWAVEKKIKTVSAMGAGGKKEISEIRVADISKTFGDPLARKVRSELRQLGVTKGIQAVFSPEPRCQTHSLDIIGTVSYMPNAFGCHAAATALKLLLAETGETSPSM